MSDFIELPDIANKYKNQLKLNFLEIKAKFDELNENRYWLTISFSNDNNKNKILVILEHPSKINKITLTKLIKHYSTESIYSLTIINLFSTIGPSIKGDKLTNKILLENEDNINIIKEKINNENYDKCILGGGQHLILYITKCKNKCIDRYEKIIDIIINKNIKTFYFGQLVYNNLLPINPYCPKLKLINDKFNILELDLNLLSTNLQSIK
jgi:hypothetical protein